MKSLGNSTTKPKLSRSRFTFRKSLKVLEIKRELAMNFTPVGSALAKVGTAQEEKVNLILRKLKMISLLSKSSMKNNLTNFSSSLKVTLST